MKEAKGITTYQRIERYLAAGHLMSNMFFPDNPDLCRANEIIFRTNFANWWSQEVAKLGKHELERRILNDTDSGLDVQIPPAAQDPCAWVRSWIFDAYLRCYGGIDRSSARAEGLTFREESGARVDAALVWRDLYGQVDRSSRVD